MDFGVKNTAVANHLTIPVYSATYVPVYTAQNLPGQIQFSNFNTLAAFYTQIDKVVSVNIRFTVDVSAPVGEFTGQILVTPPVLDFIDANSVVGAITTLSQVGLFGNLNGQLSISGDKLVASFVNAAGPINIVGAVMQLLGSYMSV